MARGGASRPTTACSYRHLPLTLALALTSLLAPEQIGQLSETATLRVLAANFTTTSLVAFGSFGLGQVRGRVRARVVRVRVP